MMLLNGGRKRDISRIKRAKFPGITADKLTGNSVVQSDLCPVGCSVVRLFVSTGKSSAELYYAPMYEPSEPPHFRSQPRCSVVIKIFLLFPVEDPVKHAPRCCHPLVSPLEISSCLSVSGLSQ